MSFDESPEYNPFEVERYVVSNMQFFKRWTLNNITLNQLNSILIDQQMMPGLGSHAASRGVHEDLMGTVETALEDSYSHVRYCAYLLLIITVSISKPK